MCSPRLTYVVIGAVLIVMAIAYLGVTIAYVEIYSSDYASYGGHDKWWPALDKLPYLFPGIMFLGAGIVGILAGTCGNSSAQSAALRNAFMFLCIASVAATAYTPYAVRKPKNYESQQWYHDPLPDQLLLASFIIACVSAAVCVAGAIITCCCFPNKRQYA